MADSNFSVNTDAMGPAVDGLKSLGDRLSQITQHLESRLDGLGKPWGEDKNGENFFKQYGNSRDQTLTGAASMADATHGVAEGIRTMIKGYTDIDDKAKDTAKNLARNGDGGNGNNGGGGYGGGSYGGGDNPPLTSERRRLLPEIPGTPTKRMGALIPAERGIPASEVDGTPLEPMERLQPREGTALLPAEEGVPAEPLQRETLREGTLRPAEKDVPAEPLQRATLREGTLLPREGTAIPDEAPAEPLERVREPLLSRTEAEPMHPLLRAERSIPAEPLQPLQPAEGRVAYPTHEGTPVEQPQMFERARLEPVHESIPAERLEPLQPAEGRVAYPTHEGTPVAEPRLERVHEGIPQTPLEPTRVFERVQDGTPLQPLHESVPAIPAEPRGFAELEPERFTPAEPEIPAVPPVPEQ